jgi:hypothetical protein
VREPEVVDQHRDHPEALSEVLFQRDVGGELHKNAQKNVVMVANSGEEGGTGVRRERAVDGVAALKKVLRAVVRVDSPRKHKRRPAVLLTQSRFTLSVKGICMICIHKFRRAEKIGVQWFSSSESGWKIFMRTFTLPGPCETMLHEENEAPERDRHARLLMRNG